MSMIGLDRITDRILDDSRLEAERILSEAQADVARIRADYQGRAEEIRKTLRQDAEKEAMERIARAKSTAATQKRNFILQRKSDLVDEVFEETLQQMRTLEGEKYTSLLIGLLAACFLEQLEAEKDSRLIYGEEDAEEPEAYEVILNPRDWDRYGKAVIEGANKKLASRVPKEKLARLKLASADPSVDGGLILRCGSVETNSSFSLLFAQLREELEAEVSEALFTPRKRN